MNRSLLTKIVLCILTLMLTTALTFAEGFSAQGSDPTMSVVKVLADAYSKKTGAEIKLDGGGSSKGAKAALEGVKILKVNGIAPTEATLRDKRYPIARTVHFATKGKATPIVQGFWDFALSAERQKLVKEAGFVMIQK